MEFDEELAKKGCKGCAMSKSCGKIKCPNCNYEMYPGVDMKIIKSIKNWGKGLWGK
jgi:hypothetical protein